MSIKGSVDQLSASAATGWIYDTAANRPVVVEAILHHRVIGEAMADFYRHDLAAVGFGDGRCGYTIEFHAPIDPAYLPFVAIRPAGGDVELPRTSLSGFAEHLGALYTQLPTAGRQRSVFGGLWTDRTDALAMLEGRRRLARFSETTAALVERFVTHGHVVVTPGHHDDHHQHHHDHHGASDHHGHDHDPELDDLERRFARMFFRHELQDLLAALFDDLPVITAGRTLRAMQQEFRQPCSGESLASPLECVGLVSSPDGGMTSIELVRDSHKFPDFTRTGDARWALSPGAAALSHAVSVGSRVEIVTLRADQIAVIAAGTIYRVLHPSAEGTSDALCLPRRQLPLRPAAGRPARQSSAHAGQIALAA